MQTSHENSLVLPQWLTWRHSAQQREAIATTERTISGDNRELIKTFLESVESFREKRNPFVGSELLGLGIILGQTKITKELAEYVINNPILGPVAQGQASEVLNFTKSEESLDRKVIIESSKKRLLNYVTDSFAWVDQARAYTVLGHTKKARRSILIALHLSPGNRHIARSAIRFFIHIGEWDTAFDVAKRAYALTSDPFIYGPWISVGIKIGKIPPEMKSMSKIAMASPRSFLFSEVLESLGTLEVENANSLKARKLFKRAWEDPAKAVVSHSQWVLRKHFPHLAAEGTMEFSQSHEALSWLHYITLDFEKALHSAIEWGFEEPYSRGPFVQASGMACALGKFPQAIEITSAACIPNPADPILANNLAFAYARNGQINEAKLAFEPLVRLVEDEAQIAPVATLGLLRMSEGFLEEGTRHYEEAMRRANKAGQKRIALSAGLHYLESKLDVARIIDADALKLIPPLLKKMADPMSLGIAESIIRKMKAVPEICGEEGVSLVAELVEGVKIGREQFLREVAVPIIDSNRQIVSASPALLGL